MSRFLFPLFLLFMSCRLSAAVVAPVSNTSSSIQLTLSDIKDLSNRQLKKKLGRRLTLRESIGFRILRGKMKRAERRAAKGKGSPWLKLVDGAIYLVSGGYAALLLAILLEATFLWWLGLFGLFLGMILGAIGMKIYRDKDPRKRRLSAIAFWISFIPVAVVTVVSSLLVLAAEEI